MNANNLIEASNLLKMWKELVLWRNWRKTAFIFGITLTLLLDIAVNPIISVLSVAGAIVLGICICYCCYVWGMQKLHRSNVVKHPCQRYLDMNVTISKETAEQLAHLIIMKVNPILLRLRSLFFVEDLLNSLKLLLLFCFLNVVGDYINGMTLLILGFVLLFTVPKVYMWKKATINMQLQQLQQFKSQLLPSKNKTIPTVSVDPEFLSVNSSHGSTDSDNDIDDNVVQYISYEQDNGQGFTTNYNWQEQNNPDAAFENMKLI